MPDLCEYTWNRIHWFLELICLHYHQFIKQPITFSLFPSLGQGLLEAAAAGAAAAAPAAATATAAAIATAATAAIATAATAAATAAAAAAPAFAAAAACRKHQGKDKSCITLNTSNAGLRISK